MDRRRPARSRPAARSRSSADRRSSRPASMCRSLMRSRRTAAACSELDPGVDAVGLARVGGDVRDDAAAAARRWTRSRRSGTARPARSSARAARARARAPSTGRRRSSELISRMRRASSLASVPSTTFDHRAVGAADDAAVEARIGRLGAEDRRVRAFAPVRLDELLQQPGGEHRRVAGEDEHVAVVAGERGARRSGPRRRCRAAPPAPRP